MKQRFDDDRNKWVNMFLCCGIFLSTQVVGKAVWGAKDAGNGLCCGEGCKLKSKILHF